MGESEVAGGRPAEELGRATDALRESEEKYRSLVDHSLHGVLLTTPSGETLAANPEACRMLQRTEQELVRLGRAGIADSDDPRWAAFIEERRRAGFARREVDLIRKDGSKVPVEVSSAVFADRNGQLRTSISLIDLTERKRVERATNLIADAGATVSLAIERPEVLRGLLSLIVPRFADVCVVDLDEGGELHRAALEQRAGLPDWPAGTRPSVGATRVFRSGKPEVIPVVTDDGDGLRTLGVRSALRVPLVLRGKSMGVLSLLILDGTRSFVADDLHTAAALADRAALALENARLFQEAREANRGRDDVLKMVSHDLRNSLNAIGFIATELARQGGSPLATQIRSAATLADRLLGDMGALLVIQSGALVLGRVMESVDSILKEVADLFRPLADARAIELRAVTEQAGLTAFVDRHRLVQAVSNVVANAVEISQEGGRVDMAVKQVGDEVVFAVSDSGPGIAPGDVDEMFSKVHWGNDGRRRASVGLGLVISKEYVEAHGGRIRVQSQPGSGSTFTIAVPIRPNDPPPEPRPSRGALGSSR
ncbi:MAG TPA: ATP-binding protein [Polyangia bacterium]